MLDWILVLLSFIYGPTIRDLGDARWPVREAASARLAASGWHAWPALYLGGRNDEANNRCDVLLERVRPPVWMPVALAVTSTGRPSDAALRFLRPSLMNYAYRDNAPAVWILPVWRTGKLLPFTLIQRDYLHWYVSTQPYLNDGTPEGETFALLEAIRRNPWFRH